MFSIRSKMFIEVSDKGMGKYDARFKEIGRNIANIRTKKGLSQDDLAYKVGISKSYLSKIEAPNSNKSFSLDVLLSIADALNVSAATLLQENEKSPKNT